MRIRNNRSARFALRENGKSTKVLKKNLEKLSSGYRINRAADDAAGLAISEKMRANVTELTRCQTNVQEGLDLARTADSALAEINDMLNRAKGLCLQAANGTYDANDRAEISKELNALFTEIDRITEGSCHNTVRLFRSDNAVQEEENFHYERREVYRSVDELTVWGELDFVQDGIFSPAPSAIPATAEFELDDSIDFDDKLSLNGKSMRIGDTLYYFTTNYMASPPPSSYSGTQKLEQIMLNGSGIRSTEDALRQIARRTSGAGKITMEIDKDARKVKLSAALSSLNWSISTRDGPVDGYVADGSGTPGNGMSAQNPLGTSSVGQIDSGGGANNLPVYSKTATCEYVMSRLGSTLTDTDVTNLQYNTLYVAGNTIQLKDLGFTKGMTSEQVGQKLVSAVNALSNASRGYQAVYEDSTKTLTVTLTNKTNSNTALAGYYIYERTVSPSSDRIEDTAHRWTSGSLGIQSKLEPGTGEKGAALEITIPAGSAGPFSVQIGSSTYLFYNSDTHPLTTPGYRYTSYSTYPTNTVNLKNVSNAQQYVLNLVESYARGLPSSQIQSVTRTGNTIRIQAFQGAPLNATVRDGSPITVTPYDYQSGTGVTTSNSFKVGSDDFKQESTISFDISGVSAPTDLVGKGFGVSFSDYAAPYKFQFTDDGSAESGYTAIDISSCASLADVAAAAETVLKRRIISRANQISSVTVDGNDLKINILREGSTSYYITDGEEGIMKEGTITFAGGDDAGHSYKELDFSSINRDNLDSLLGKGFRIHCASCPGEYINVFFCWTNDGTIPPVFDRLDSSTGEIRKIYNIPVELSKIKSGDKIVESIVDQVHPYMNHYTDVMVGDPPSTLLAVERRTGNVTDGAGTLYLGRVAAGIETNFVYSVEDVKVFDEPDVIKPKTHKVKIYVGSGTDYPYIDIHLPHIDPEWLDLYPGQVDLTVQDPLELMGRVDKANIAIADARGTIGADYNRLEHASQDIGQANIQLTDAESRIRDADIAELMMENVKLQILSQAQHSMMAQANGLPQYALQLLQ